MANAPWSALLQNVSPSTSSPMMARILSEVGVLRDRGYLCGVCKEPSVAVTVLTSAGLNYMFFFDCQFPTSPPVWEFRPVNGRGHEGSGWFTVHTRDWDPFLSLVSIVEGEITCSSFLQIERDMLRRLNLFRVDKLHALKKELFELNEQNVYLREIVDAILR